MAEKKTTRKPRSTKPKAEKPEAVVAIYKGQRYMVLETTDNRYKLTDGMIHFWVRAADVKAEKVNAKV